MEELCILEISQLLHTTYGSVNKQIRRTAEQTLKALSENTLPFISSLLAIITSTDSRIDSNMKLQAAIRIKKLAKEHPLNIEIIMKEIINRKAKFEFTFLQEYNAGIMLTGTEVKSLRAGEANLSDAYCVIRDGELVILSMFIGEYNHGNVHNHETRRTRKLLMRKSELHKIEKRVNEKGLTIVPYKIFFNERGIAKVGIALAQGKKTYDKRDSLKEKDMNRDLDRNKKLYS